MNSDEKGGDSDGIIAHRITHCCRHTWGVAYVIASDNFRPDKVWQRARPIPGRLLAVKVHSEPGIGIAKGAEKLYAKVCAIKMGRQLHEL